MTRAAVTVVIVTRDRRDSLETTLRHLARLPERPPVVVVDNGSRDGTAAALRERWPDVQLVRLRRNLGAAARTVGVLAASTPYVAFSDDDSWWAPGALARAAELLDGAPRLGLLAGRVVVLPRHRDDPICAAMARGPRSPAVAGGHAVLGFLACGAVVRAEAYLAVGGFHPRFGIGGEEELLALDLTAAGWHCCYHPDPVAYHAPHPGPRGRARVRRQVRNALWTAWLRRRPAGLARRSVAALADAPTAADRWAGLVEAVVGLPWVVGERRAVPPAVEALRAALDRDPGAVPTGADDPEGSAPPAVIPDRAGLPPRRSSTR